MNSDRADPRYWKKLHTGVGSIAAVFSLVLALSLCFAAGPVVALFRTGGDPITWTQLSGELLTLVTIFYLPGLRDVDRYRPHAWIAAVIARGTIALLCLSGVLFFHAPKAFFLWGVVELVIGGVLSWILCGLEKAETGRFLPPRSEWNGGPRPIWTPTVVNVKNPQAVECWKTVYCWVAWIGIAANCIFVLPLVFAPHWMLRMLGVTAMPVLWAQMAGLLLGLVSVFYIPATRDPDRYRLFAWLAILPSRSAGVLFCTVAVVGLGANDAFGMGVLLDLPFAVAQTIILSRLEACERWGEPGWGTWSWRNWWRMGVAFAAALVVLGTIGWHKLAREYRQELANDSMEEYFKHGSVGTEDKNGLPYWIWITLPDVFPEYLPKPGGYSSLGFLWEPGTEIPVGFSKRKIGFDRIGINCAMCHAGSVQVPGEARPRIYVGAPAVTVDVLGYQRFLFACANDPRFNAATLMPAIARQTRLSWLDNLLYRFALIPATRNALKQQSQDWRWTYESDRPYWGPGRIEPFNPVKVAILHSVDPHVQVGSTLGTSDMEPLWNLGGNPGRAFHWDGLNTDAREVVDSSALGDGATTKSIPRAQLRVLEAWLKTSVAPKFPFAGAIKTDLVPRGAEVYQAECARCHAPGSEGIGKVIPVSGEGGVGTDDNRAKMWTPESAAAYNAYLGSRSWRFTHFRSTGGYVNVPLDGIWLRAPYLHNGSVPTLVDLLKPPAERPAVFWRGLNDYDPVNVGYVSDTPEARAHGFRYDTAGRGNSNAGHTFGTTLPEDDKRALVEYLKTL